LSRIAAIAQTNAPATNAPPAATGGAARKAVRDGGTTARRICDPAHSWRAG